jgi:hypothetical protein
MAFMSQLMGQIFQGTGDYEQIGYSNVVYYAPAWDAAFSYIAAHLLAQAGFSGLMGNPIYNLTTDTLSVSGSSYDVAVQFADQSRGTELSHLATNDIFVLFSGDSPVSTPLYISETASGGGTNTLVLGVAPSGVTVSDDASGTIYVNYTSTDMVEVLSSMAYTGGNVAGITVAEYIQQIAFNDGTIWNLADGIHLTATSGYATVFGTATGGDTLDAGSLTGAVLWAYTGDNTFIAGPEATMNAGNGTDLFVINPDSAPASSGGAVINPNVDATGDQVVLHSVTESQVFLSDNYSGQFFISTSNGDLVTINGGSLGDSGVTIGNVAGVVFDDSTVWNLSGTVTLTATGSSETLFGLTTPTNFVASGSADVFHGYNADDTFIFTSGSSPASAGGDTIYEAATGGSNAVVFHSVTPSAVAMSDDTSGDLIFQFGTDLVTVSAAGSFSYDTGVTIDHLQQVTFDGGTTWTLADGLNLTATSDHQVLYGSSSGGDTLTASGNYDTLHAYAGTEVLVAGPGASLYNGTGNDTDVINSGSSPSSNSAVIYANASGGSDNVIQVHDVISTDIVMWDDTAGNLTVATPTDQFVIAGGSYDGSTGFAVGNIHDIALDSGSPIDLTGGLNLTALSDSQSLYGTGHGDNMTAAGNYDTLNGIAGNNTMTGNADSSSTTYFNGGSGNDVMIAAGGTNYMTMGTGEDTIKIESASSTNTVTGFSTAYDKLDFSNILDAVYDPVHDAIANFVQETTSGGNTQFSVDTTGAAHFTSALVTLSSVTGLDDVATLIAAGHLIVHS